MGHFLQLWILLQMLIILHAYRSLGCWEKEKIALLKLKDVFTYPMNGSDEFSSWDGKHCCKWQGVECSNSTKRVIKLALYSMRAYMECWNVDFILESYLFHPFEELQELRLQVRCIKGFNGVLRLNKLELLDLSDNWLTEIPSLSGLESLKSLSLRSNQLNGSLPEEGFNGVLRLNKLELLDLSFNRLTEIPSLSGLESLKRLSLASNELNGSFPKEGICKMKSLQELDFSQNRFKGSIPPCMSNLTSLRILELSENNLGGTIPSDLLSSLKSLEYLSLSFNHFQGSISLSSLANNSNLEVLKLDSLNKELRVETESTPWKPLFQLKFLGLSNCKINEPSRSIPSFLLTQYDLRLVNLSHNAMVGEFPTWLLKNNTRLEMFILEANSFKGKFVLPADYENLDLYWLDVSNNDIQGPLSPYFGHAFPNLSILNMSRNAVQGNIPPSIGHMNNLGSLDLSSNYFTGELPEQMITGCKGLRFLKLSNNSLQGQLFPEKWNLTSLWSLFLDNNLFSGRLSRGLVTSSSLQELHLNNNFISGEIPEWIGELPSLFFLVASRNSFKGSLPKGFFCLPGELWFLDLSFNGLSGNIPPCFNFSSLKYLHLQGNELSGHLPKALSRSSSLVTLDIRDNKLSGEIPTWINLLPNLIFLLLKGNNFVGSIPFQLCQLRNISVLDLSSNSLAGPIPSCFNGIPFGRKKMDGTFDVFSTWGSRRDPKVMEHTYQSLLDVQPYVYYEFYISVAEVIEFISKRRFESYTKSILNFMSGIDLSLNKLTGHIPSELGLLSDIHTLNLSHNQLTGSIPQTFSNLKKIESLDLSNNKLSGEIPPSLVQLNFLSVFSVADNNLSGHIPDKNQFGTFNWSSYEGNPLLCELPLQENCRKSTAVSDPINPGENDEFKESFFESFVPSYIVAFLGFVAFIYLNSNFRMLLFKFVEAKLYNFR